MSKIVNKHVDVTCPRCRGARVMECGAGHYGEQQGNAGELKAVFTECTLCGGAGTVDTEEETVDLHQQTPLRFHLNKEGMTTVRTTQGNKSMPFYAALLMAPDRMPIVYATGPLPQVIDASITRCEAMLEGLRRMKEQMSQQNENQTTNTEPK